jgi:hypothetical protein
VNPFTKIGVDLLALGKIYPTFLTDKSAVQLFMKKLYPVASDTKLIRLGPAGDGGYLVPDDLAGIEACFSPGVAFSSGFEKDCANLGMKVFLADRSVDQPAEMHEQFFFTKKYIGVTTNDDFMTLDDWVDASLPHSQSDLLLQIDIEGFEYEVFLAMSDRLMRRFRIIVVEFHAMGQLFNLPFFRLASRAFDKILQNHTCVHIHPNSCCEPLYIGGLVIPSVAEFTFLRTDRISNPSYARTFPHPLDADNTDKPPFPLPQCWYSNSQQNTAQVCGK